MAASMSDSVTDDTWINSLISEKQSYSASPSNFFLAIYAILENESDDIYNLQMLL